MDVLTIQAGAQAYAKIQRDGLQAEDIAAVFGASGAAKWLGIYGLDSAIFGEWLQPATQKILLYGTSVGAFKLAAAAQRDPVDAFARLAERYIEQSYPNGITPDAIVRETSRIIDAVLPTAAVAEILASEKYIFSCAAVQCSGPLASESLNLQRFGMLQAAWRSLWWGGASRLPGRLDTGFKRVIFSREDARDLLNADAGRLLTLGEDNFKRAILASGSLPVYMRGVADLDASRHAVYRDGGLLDYHPVPDNVLASGDGLVLYPHFFPHLVERWFDKFYPWRKVPAARLSNVVLVSPSASFIESLPQRRIPDRGDFVRLQGRDSERIALWRDAAERSFELGESFLALVRSGDVAARVTHLPA